MTSADARNDEAVPSASGAADGDAHDKPGESDPFDRFNQAMGMGDVTDPYPELAALRAHHHVVTPGAKGIDNAVPRPDLPGLYLAVSYDAVSEILRDGRRFSSAGSSQLTGKMLGRTILEMDEPEHHVYRSIIQQAFSRRAMDRWEPEVVRPVVDELLDRVLQDAETDRRVELVRRLTFPFPIRVIARLLGLPGDQVPRFHSLAVRLISGMFDFDDAVKASAEMAKLLTPLIVARRHAPDDDIISLLTAAEHDGQQLTQEEIVSFCRLLLIAGAETTYRSSSNLLVGLLTHPDQLDAVRADAGLLPQAIEEGLRWECPTLTLYRTATEDTEVCGVPIPAGTVVWVQLAAANHDERYWDQPERFDIFRRQGQTPVAFASGPHICLGMHLARLEIRVALGRLFERLPGLRLDPGQPPPVITGRSFRAPTAIHAVYDPA